MKEKSRQLPTGYNAKECHRVDTRSRDGLLANEVRFKYSTVFFFSKQKRTIENMAVRVNVVSLQQIPEKMLQFRLYRVNIDYCSNRREDGKNRQSG